jgi:hypothetical protein
MAGRPPSGVVGQPHVDLFFKKLKIKKKIERKYKNNMSDFFLKNIVYSFNFFLRICISHCKRINPYHYQKKELTPTK